MTRNIRDRFIIPEDDENDITLIDTITGETYTDNFTDVVAKLNEINNELVAHTIKEYMVKEANFTQMGGFSKHRNDRGQYIITSKNVIPKHSPIIEIKAPDAIWNERVTDLIWDILKEK